MSRSSLVFALLFVLAISSVPAAFGGSQAQRGVRRARKTANQAQTQLPSPPPLTPEQMPAQPPQVSYLDGQLTIIAANSTLGDILTAVQKQTGANIEVPAGANERIAGRMGPGLARDVIAQLLNGSRFDYVMIASATNPSGIEHLVLTPRGTGSDSGTPSPQPQNAAVQGQPLPSVAADPAELAQDNTDDNNQDIFGAEPLQSEDSANAEVPQQQQQPQPGQPFFQPQVPGQNQQQEGNNGFQPMAGTTPIAPPPQGQPGQVKTPQQLLQEIQQMRNQQNQQQQQEQ